MTEKITYVNRTQRTSKAGKPYTSLSLKVESRGDKFINGFGNQSNESWKVGDTVDILIEQKGEYLNFVPAEGKKAEEITINAKLEHILTKLGLIQNYLQTNLPKRTSDGNLMPSFPGEKVKVEYPDDETISADQIPF